jgi:hypothetical protein
MPNESKRKNALNKHKAPSLSRHIDLLRDRADITITEFAKDVMGINKDIYRRRLESVDGFTDKELVSACNRLGCSITIQNTVIGSLVTNDLDTGAFAEVLPSEGKEKGSGWKKRLEEKNKKK